MEIEQLDTAAGVHALAEQQPTPEDSTEQSVAKMPPRRVIHSEETETTSDQRMIAMLAHLLGIVSGPIVKPKLLASWAFPFGISPG